MKVFSAQHYGASLCLVFLLLAAAVAASGAAGDVDPGFDPRLTVDLTANYGGGVAVQPDGKMIVYGAYNNGAKPYLQRLNADGTVDPTFYCPACRMLVPRSVAVQPDGKIVIGGGLRLIRVNPDGSRDASFVEPANGPLPACTTYNLLVQPDGKILNHCSNTVPQLQEFVRRLNADGSLDLTFGAIRFMSVPGRIQYMQRMILLPDGRILAGGGFTGTTGPFGWLNRYHTDGTLDTTFQAAVSSEVTGVGLLPDGRYLISGDFSSVNGVPRPDVARLSADGSLDQSLLINLQNDESAEELRVLPNGQFYVRVQQHPFRADPIQRFVRYQADGAVDPGFSQTFQYPSPLWEVDAESRIVVFRGRTGLSNRYHRLNTDGSDDAGFNPALSGYGFAAAAALQPDGKIVIAGDFTRVNGFAAGRIARLNVDGTPDTAFNPGSGFDVAPNLVAVQPDGKILAAGLFTAFNGTPRLRFVRLNPDGSLDAGFNPVLDSFLRDVKPLADGKILIGGIFTTVNGISRRALARLNADGSLDASFAPVFNASAVINTIFVEPDGKFLAGGVFNGVSGVNRANLVRFNADGAVDPTFNRTFAFPIGQVLPRGNGQYIVASGDPFNVTTPSALFVVNNDGTTDFSFNQPELSGGPLINQIFRQPNGNIIFGGRFDWVNNRFVSNVARLGPMGQMDIYFPSVGANGPVNRILGQSDGRIIFAGDFSGVEDVGRAGIARLTLSDRTSSTFFDFDGDGRADISVFRPSTGVWYGLLSGSGAARIQAFGADGDLPAPGDYDGDGKTDFAVFRPSTGRWLLLQSTTNTVTEINWGLAGDIPRPADVNGDGRTELVVYRPSTGIWYRFVGGFVNFGAPGDQPLVADFDGDGQFDAAVFRPSTGEWWYAASTALQQHRAVRWGQSGDIPAPADYDGDNITDFAVFRPSTGAWYVLFGNGLSYTIVPFGLSGDKPVPADYDGDGKADFAVFRPSTGLWYLLRSTSGFGAVQWGLATDVPTPNALLP